MHETVRRDLTPSQGCSLLRGVRVTDFSQAMVGSHGTMLLALLGAEVIKIESAKRIDIARDPAHIGDSYRFREKNVETSPIFNNVALNKLSVRLNLSDPRGVELAKRIVSASDAVVENFRPGVMAKLGLDYSTLRKLKPDIIMVSASSAGQTGPESRYAGYAAIFAALGGLSHLTGYPDLAPSEIRGSADSRGGLWIAFAVLMALNYRQRTGRGQYIDFSVIEGLSTFIGDSIIDYIVNGRNQCRQGNRHDFMAPHNCYACLGTDEWVTIAVATDEEWQRLCEAMGKPELATDGRFHDVLNRWHNQEELDKIICAWTSQQTKNEVTRALQATGVAAFPCMSNKDICEDIHLGERDAFSQVKHPVMGLVTVLSAPWKFSATPANVVSPAPLLGQHNSYVFGQLLKLSSEEIALLEKEQVIY